MAFDAFIKIAGIDGESTDDKHQGWIEIVTYSHGLTQSTSSTASSSGGASAERANFQNFTFTKQLDIASPALNLACADGTHIDEIIVELCRAGTEKVKFMEYKMNNCIISGVSVGGAGDGDLPSETVTIDFGKINWAYTQQKRQGGGASGNMATGWDLQKNCKA
jgi:type VI secretion system secreted protein Hcp